MGIPFPIPYPYFCLHFKTFGYLTSFAYFWIFLRTYFGMNLNTFSRLLYTFILFFYFLIYFAHFCTLLHTFASLLISFPKKCILWEFHDFFGYFSKSFKKHTYFCNVFTYFFNNNQNNLHLFTQLCMFMHNFAYLSIIFNDTNWNTQNA